MRALRASAAVALCALAPASCGGGEEASDPADLVPEGAPVYLDATLDSDEQVANAEALIAELGEVPLLGSTLDPEELIANALDESAAEEGVDFSYAEDVEPWLGERAALAFLSFENFEGEGTPDFVLVLETSDEQIALDSMKRILDSDEEASYEETELDGEPFLAVEEGGGLLFADGFMVIAPTDDALAQALDARDGDSLPDSDVFSDAQEGLPEERLGFGFVDVAAALDYAVETGGVTSDEVALLEGFYGDGFTAPVSVALTAAERSAALDVASGFSSLGFPTPGVSELTAQAPADARGAVGLGDVGESAQALIDQIDTAAAASGNPEITADAISSAFEAQTGLPLDEALAAFGDASVWVSGTPPNDYAVGLDVVAEDPELAGRLLDGAATAFGSQDLRPQPPVGGGEGFSTVDPGSDLPFLNAELDGDRVSVTAATSRARLERPTEALGSDASFGDAVAALGDDYEITGYADLAEILGLALRDASALDVVTGDAAPDDLVARYLADKLGFAVTGARSDDDRTIQRLVVGLE